MSAIAAIFDRSGQSIAQDRLQRVNNALKIYGPKISHIKVTEPFGLSASLETGFFAQDRFERQPLLLARWSLVFSGYIQYRAELASKLGIASERLAKMPDSALFHAAWQKWGERAGEHVEGGYAAIIGDSEQNCLTAIRSAHNAPPLYYHETPERVVVASVPKGLFAYGDVERKLDESKIADTLVLNFEINPGSYFVGVHVIRAGTYTRFTQGAEHTQRFFDLRTSPDVRFANEQEYVEAARSLLFDAVEQCWNGNDVPAAHLSAGMDSSAVVATMLDVLASRNMPNQKVDTYTHVPEPGWDGRAYGHLRIGDESPAVKAFAAKYPQINPHFVDCAGHPLGVDMDKIFLLAELPSRGLGNIHWGLEIDRQIRASGKRLTLSGQSGNATLSFNAKGLYGQWFRQGRWIKLWRELAADKTPGLRFGGLYVRAIAPNIPNAIARHIAKWRGHASKLGWQGYSAISPEYAEDMQVDQRAEEAGWDTGYSGFSDPHEMMYTMLERGGREEKPALQLAITTMTGVRSMDPMGDPRIMRFCSGIPPEQFLQNGNQRYLITRMMKGRLPDDYFTPMRGRQSADWHFKMTRDLQSFRDKVERIKANPEMARRFDVERLEKMLDSWPEKTPLSYKDHPDYTIAMLGMGRATNMADYINWVEGKNI